MLMLHRFRGLLGRVSSSISVSITPRPLPLSSIFQQHTFQLDFLSRHIETLSYSSSFLPRRLLVAELAYINRLCRVSISYTPFNRVESQLDHVTARITKTEQEIEDTRQSIKDLNTQLKNEKDPNEKVYLRTEKNKLIDILKDLHNEMGKLLDREKDLHNQLGQNPSPKLASFNSPQTAHNICADLGYIRDDRFENPLKLVSSDQSEIRLMDRDPSFKALMDSLSSRLEASHYGHRQLDKSHSPILAVYGGPGSGKSRFLDEVACSQSRKNYLQSANEEYPDAFRITMENAVANFSHLQQWNADFELSLRR